MKLKTRVLTTSLVVALLGSTVTSFAAPTWKFAGYDQNTYDKIEAEYDEKGVPTGATRVMRDANGYAIQAKNVEWKHAFWEAEFPHFEAIQLYLDGIAQNTIAYSGTIAESVQEYRPVYWEAHFPYRVVTQMYSRIPYVMDWRVQPTQPLSYALYNEAVSKRWADYGFSGYATIDGEVVDASDYLAALATAGHMSADEANAIAGSYDYLMTFHRDSGTQRTLAQGTTLDVYPPVVRQEILNGPQYSADGMKLANADLVPLTQLLNNFALAGTGWFNADLVEVQFNDTTVGATPFSMYNDELGAQLPYESAKLEWVYGGYEAATMQMYEVARINGVLMDGGVIRKLVRNADGNWVLRSVGTDGRPYVKPTITRYTGGIANEAIINARGTAVVPAVTVGTVTRTTTAQNQNTVGEIN